MEPATDRKPGDRVGAHAPAFATLRNNSFEDPARSTKSITDVFHQSVVPPLTSDAKQRFKFDPMACFSDTTPTFEKLGTFDDSDQLIDLYLDKNFAKENAQLIKKTIYKHPLLLRLVRESTNPKYIYAGILCAQNPPLDQNFQSITIFYQFMLKALNDHFLQSLPAELQLNSVDIKSFSEFLEERAWKNIPIGDPLPSLDNYSQNPQFISFIKIHDFFNTDSSFSVFQDFFAARYMLRLIKNDFEGAIKTLASVKNDPRYKNVFYFVAGLLKDQPVELNRLFEVIDKNEATGFYSIQLKIRSLEECNWSAALKNKDLYFNEINTLCNHLFNPNYWQLIKQPLLEIFEISPTITQKVLYPIIARGILHKDSQVRMNAIQILIKAPFDSIQVITLLRESGQDPVPEIRAMTALGYKKALCPWSDALPYHLEPFAIDPSILVRQSVANALGSIECKPERAVPFLFKLLFDPEEPVREEAFFSLSRLNVHFSEDEIASLKAEKDPIRKKILIRLFGTIGIEAAWLVSLVMEPNFKVDVVQALINTQQEKSWIPLLIEQFAKNPQMSECLVPVFIQLGKIYPNDMFAHLSHFIENKDTTVCFPSLAEIIGEIGKDHEKDSALKLLKSLSEKHEEQPELLYALSQLGSDCKGIITRLEPFLKSETELKIRAIKALGMLFSANAAMAPKICRLLQPCYKTINERVKIEVIKALGKVNEFELILVFLCDEATQDKCPSYKVRTAFIQIIGELAKKNIKLALGFRSFLLSSVNSDHQEEFSETFRTIALILENADLPNCNYLIESLISAFYKMEEPRNEKAMKGLIRTLSSIRSADFQKIILFLQDLFTKSKNQGKPSAFEDEECEALSELIKGDLTPLALQKMVVYLQYRLDRGNEKIQKHAINTLLMLNAPSKTIIEQLKIPLQSDEPRFKKHVLLGLGAVKNATIEQVIPLINNYLSLDSPYRKEACASLSQFNLSSHPNIMIKLLEIRDPFGGWPDPLKMTPLEDLIKQSNEPIYQLPIIHKCLAVNKELFLFNGKISFYFDKELKTFPYNGDLNLFQASLRTYQKDSIFNRAKNLEKNRCYDLAGDYYKRVNKLDKMIQCYRNGLKIFRETKNLQKLEDNVGAVFSLGMSYMSGLGLREDEMENRIQKAAEFFLLGINLSKQPSLEQHAPSAYLYGLCKAHELEAFDGPVKFKPVPVPYALHFFNTSKYCMMLDKENALCAAGTIAIALASLEPTAIDRAEIIRDLERKERPDFRLPAPYVVYGNKLKNLSIWLPQELAQNGELLEKIANLGLIGESTPPTKLPRSQRTYVIRFVIKESEIEEFLQDKLGLSQLVYFELLDNAKRTSW